MAKRTTDLFEVFHPRDDNGASSGRKRQSKARKKSSSDSRSKSGFDGIFLDPRQVLLASCVLALLMVLAFTLGLGVGRRGDGGGDPSLSRTSANDSVRFYIRGRMPRENLATGRPANPDTIHRDLVQKKGFRPSDIHVTEGEGDHFWVFYGPFRSEDQAQDILLRKKLGVMPLNAFYPFSFAEVVQQSR